MKTEEREFARRLRRDGLSIREIEQRVGVSRSSVSLWVRDIALTPEQDHLLRRRNPARSRQLAGNAAWSAHRRAIRLARQESGRAAARRGDALHAAGCMLYWGEGWKSRHVVQIANSDPPLLRLFMTFLRTYFGVPDAKVRVTCNLFADHVERQLEVESFWLEVLQLPRSCLRRSVVNVYSSATRRKRRKTLRWGTCSLSVCDVGILQHIYGAIQEYGGFERPEWLG